MTHGSIGTTDEHRYNWRLGCPAIRRSTFDDLKRGFPGQGGTILLFVPVLLDDVYAGLFRERLISTRGGATVTRGQLVPPGYTALSGEVTHPWHDGNEDCFFVFDIEGLIRHGASVHLLCARGSTVTVG